MLSDIRFALRQLAKSPGFTALAVLTFALGLGATTAIFSVVYGVLLKPLGYNQPERLVLVSERRSDEPAATTYGSVAPPNFIDWRKSATSFAALAARRGASVNLTGEGEPQRVVAARVTASYWKVFDTAPVLGRVFTADEDVAGKGEVAVLSFGFWQSQFGGAADVVGRVVQLNNHATTVIGVMPAEFDNQPAAVWCPMAFQSDDLADENRGSHYLTVYGRLKPGVTLAQARSEIALIEDRLARQYPGQMKNWAATVRPLLDVLVSAQRPLLLILLGAVGGLLLIACVNVANLLLTRANARLREIAVRAALGAAPGRIVRQLLTESLVLAALGGAGGVICAYGGLKALLTLAPAGLPRLGEIGLNAPVFLGAAAVVLLSGVGFGLAPAVQAARVNLVDAMKDGNRGAGESRRRGWLRSSLVVAETALALILLVGAGLLMRSFVRLTAVNPGFDPHNAITMGVALAPSKYRTPEQQLSFVTELTRRLAAQPGVTAVGATQAMPFSGSNWVLGVSVEGRAYAAGDANLPSAGYFAVTSDYFRAMGIPLVRGRAFTDRDAAGAARVAIVSQGFAARNFPHEDPIGRRINITNQSGQVWREIVGVVADVKNTSLEADPPAQMYEPLAQQSYGSLGVIVRTAGPVPGLAAALKREVYAIDKDQPAFRIGPLEDLVSGSVARQRFASGLLGIFSGLALVLAVIGLYGVMACNVSQRTAEFGVRFALGASPGDVLRLVFASGGRVVLAGLGLGVAGALALSRLIESQLYGISARDPLVYGGLGCLFSVVAALACWLPARRAAKVDPITALRAE